MIDIIILRLELWGILEKEKIWKNSYAISYFHMGTLDDKSFSWTGQIPT